MNERKFDMNRDGLGLLLFALGLFPAVLIVKALLGTSPVESSSGDGPIALTWIRTLGGIPSLIFSAGILFLGGRLFLFGKRDGLLRNALGSAGVALSTAILFGAFSPTAGGRIGDATGGLVSSITHVALGALIGLVAVALVIWVTWLREERAPRIALASETGVDAILGEEADTGVSAAEARALIPEDLDPDLDPHIHEGHPPPAPRPLRSAPPPSPYPEDVRLKGQIPAGARPLHREPDVHSEPASAPQPSSVYRWTAPRPDLAGDGVDENLAGVEAPETVFAAEPESSSDTGPLVDEDRWGGAIPFEPAQTAAWGEPAAPDPVASETNVGQPTARGAQALGSERELSPSEEIAELVEGPAAGVSAEAQSSLPRPSWEQPNLFTEADEPPVDAYGTPLTLVEALRQEDGRGASASAPAHGDRVERLRSETDRAPENAAGVEDDPEFEALAPVPVRTPAIGLDVQDAAQEPTDADPDFEDGAVHEEDLGESEAFEDEEQDEIEDREPDESDEVGELDEEDELEGEDGALEIAARSTADEDLEPAPLDEADAGELDTPGEPAGAVPPPAEGPLVELMEQRSPARGDRSAQRMLVQDKLPQPKPAPSKTEHRRPAVESPPPAAEPREREMILEPQAVTPAQTIKSRAALPERAELLREAGCLFVDRGRVAVSMLQRQYGMDFDQACLVLDELQNLGLIGPYLGGQRRDILLTREEWLEKVGSA
jgi:hypothetical protein